MKVRDKGEKMKVKFNRYDWGATACNSVVMALAMSLALVKDVPRDLQWFVATLAGIYSCASYLFGRRSAQQEQKDKEAQENPAEESKK